VLEVNPYLSVGWLKRRVEAKGNGKAKLTHKHK
jgi:hypothetical protein